LTIFVSRSGRSSPAPTGARASFQLSVVRPAHLHSYRPLGSTPLDRDVCTATRLIGLDGVQASRQTPHPAQGVYKSGPGHDVRAAGTVARTCQATA
jgi:hypothetical protein